MLQNHQEGLINPVNNFQLSCYIQHERNRVMHEKSCQPLGHLTIGMPNICQLAYFVYFLEKTTGDKEQLKP